VVKAFEPRQGWLELLQELGFSGFLFVEFRVLRAFVVKAFLACAAWFSLWLCGEKSL
jgi:hypothetical protein